jgi:mono/diheme cytochrome c family protein
VRTAATSSGAFLIAIALTACHGPPESTFTDPQTILPAPPAPVAGASPADAEANEIFATRCAPCHGATGHGDGIAAAALTPHPRNFSDATWQTTITDASLERVIREGGEAVGKSALMPANPDLAPRPEIIAALRARVRSFGGH